MRSITMEMMRRGESLWYTTLNDDNFLIINHQVLIEFLMNCNTNHL